MKGQKSKMLGLLIYVCLSSVGLTLIKIGTGRNFTLRFSKSYIGLEVNYVLLLGMLIYIVSFLTSMMVMKTMNLSIFYPLSAGMIYIIVCLLGFFVLKEKITINQLIGMGIILIGIVIINFKK